MNLQLISVSKKYQRNDVEIPVLKDINLMIPTGKFVFIVGPSGSGKSTLLYLLGAMETPTTGEIMVDGNDLAKFNATEQENYRRDDVGFIFQNFNLISNLTAVDNVLIPYMPQGVSASLREEAVGLLNTVGLSHRLEHKPDHLSGGEQQRVAIARALLKKPKLVLADEPTGELDSKTGEEVFFHLRNLHKTFGVTVLVVTHDRRYITDDDLVVEISDGKIESLSE